ncbi:hypothetical protein HHI36_002761 [Cryptolaemus montrouzieri]|uniref:Uncharacterized protein n=1 Tax=Cryptolaemus montrouzieri TaxID=559131 RepID=A0ABD2PBL1_9CUCU
MWMTTCNSVGQLDDKEARLPNWISGHPPTSAYSAVMWWLMGLHKANNRRPYLLAMLVTAAVRTRHRRILNRREIRKNITQIENSEVAGDGKKVLIDNVNEPVGDENLKLNKGCQADFLSDSET